MKNYLRLIITFACLLSIRLSGTQYSHENLLRDLMIVDYWNKRINERLRVTYNHLLQGGYWNMPSSRMGREGEVGFGYADAPPYRFWNLRCQLTDRLEVSGNYRVFRGVKDPVLSQHGFGDFSDKGVNFKLALIHPEDSGYKLPGVSIGFEDVIGTRAFKARYIVMTQCILQENLEFSVGYGQQRIKGWFGGVNWMPFRKSAYPHLRGFSLTAEYDATPYKHHGIEPHPKGRVQRSHFNFGAKYRLGDSIDLSLSYIRGHKLAFTVSSYYNFGTTQGIFTKIDDPKPYRAPVNIEPIGDLRPESVLVPDFYYAFLEKGLLVLQAWLSDDGCGGKKLRLRIINNDYRQECDLRTQLNSLIAFLTPLNVSTVIVGIDSDGALIQEYRYKMEYARAFGADEIGPYELKVLTPMREATEPNPCCEWLLFDKKRPLFCLDFLPKTCAYFGSATGKFKYALGVQALITGYLWKDVYYTSVIGYIGNQNIGSVRDVDRLNPSQLINARTDIIRYLQQEGITLDEAYIQKTWNLGNGLFGRVSTGYFEIQYGGIAGELLHYPVNSRWAFGVEGSIVGKRKVGSCFGFSSKIRKLDGFKPTYRRFLGSQCFFNVYYDWREAKLDLRVKVGKFLANDFGARYEVSRYFPSGLRITLWYTQTNGHDKINGQIYYDKGIAFTMPLDFFYTRCTRGTWGYGMSAWLRDVGASAYTGQDLYYMLNDNRK